MICYDYKPGALRLFLVYKGTFFHSVPKYTKISRFPQICPKMRHFGLLCIHNKPFLKYFFFTSRFSYCNDGPSPYSTSGYTFPNLASAAAVAAVAASANSANSAGTGSVTTGSCTADWPDYSGVDSTTNTFESRPDLNLNDTPVSISSGKQNSAFLFRYLS